MALNGLMHPRNIYKNLKPNFKDLAIKYEEFRKNAVTDLKGNVHLDFKKPECLQALSWALLKDDFGLDVEMPLDRLIPAIPLRLNYLLWLEDLLEGDTKPLSVIDIGTGASCIYPLLGAKKNGWTFVATEVDPTNHTFAQRNVEKNGLKEKVQVMKVPEDSSLAEVVQDSDMRYDMCMCNPPFFTSNLEAWGMTSTRSDDRPEPRSVCTASPTESIAPGGEVQFVRNIINDSIKLKDKIKVYTSMLGKKTSLAPLKDYLQQLGISNFGTTEFCQGRTMRWGLGWSFDPSIIFPKPPSKVLKQEREKLKPKPPLVYKLPKQMEAIPSMEYTVPFLGSKVMAILDELKVIYEPEKSSAEKMSLTMVAVENTWSNQRKKRRLKLRQEVCKEPRMQAKEENNQTTGAHHGATGSNQQTKNTLTASIATNLNNSNSQAEKISVGDFPVTKESGNNSNSNGKDFPCDSISEKDKSHTIDKRMVSAGDSTLTPPSGESSGVLDISMEDIEDYLLKAELCVRKDADDILLEMQWKDGAEKEAMHQVLQYLKNNLK